MIDVAFVPPGTLENSPPFQRWESDRGSPSESRQGRKTVGMRHDKSLSPRWGLIFRHFADPPLKRWAIVGCPWRDKLACHERRKQNRQTDSPVADKDGAENAIMNSEVIREAFKKLFAFE